MYPVPHYKSKFHAVAFFEGCLINHPFKLNDYTLIPAEGLKVSDVIECVETNIEQIFGGQIQLKKEYWNSQSKSQTPIVVVQFKEFFAINVDDAFRIIDKKAKVLADLLSLERGSKVRLIADLCQTETGDKFERIHLPHYSGNLISDFYDRSDVLQECLQAIQSDHMLPLYISLLNEALGESNRDFKYLRLWMVLETIAKQYFTKGSDDFKVESLLRTFRNAHNVSIVLDGNHPGFEIKDYVLSWSQHRDCSAHFGGCHPDNANQCDINHRKKNICKKLTQVYGSNHVDLLWHLREEAKMVIRWAINKSSRQGTDDAGCK